MNRKFTIIIIPKKKLIINKMSLVVNSISHIFYNIYCNVHNNVYNYFYPPETPILSIDYLLNLIKNLNTTVILITSSILFITSYIYIALTSKTILISKIDNNDYKSQRLRLFLSNLKYYPTVYLYFPMSQLFYHSIFFNPKISIKRKYFLLKSGGTLALDYVIFPHSKAIQTLKLKRSFRDEDEGICNRNKSAMFDGYFKTNRISNDNKYNSTSNLHQLKTDTSDTLENNNGKIEEIKTVNMNKIIIKDHLNNNGVVTKMNNKANYNINSNTNDLLPSNSVNKDDKEIKEIEDEIKLKKNASCEEFISNYQKIAKSKNEKVLIILHGVLGGSETAQLKDMVEFYSSPKNQFFDVIICIQNKGINDTPLSQPKTYNSASYNDTKEVVDSLISNNASCEIYLIGISLGSLLLSQMLIEYPGIENIKGFASVSNPFSTENAMENIGYIGNKFLMTLLKERLINQPILQAKIGRKKMLQINSLRQFEEEFTFVINEDIVSLKSYFEKSNITKRIGQLKYYSLFFNAEDDELAPINKLDMNQCKLCIIIYNIFNYNS